MSLLMMIARFFMLSRTPFRAKRAKMHTARRFTFDDAFVADAR